MAKVSLLTPSLKLDFKVSFRPKYSSWLSEDALKELMEIQCVKLSQELAHANTESTATWKRKEKWTSATFRFFIL